MQALRHILITTTSQIPALCCALASAVFISAPPWSADEISIRFGAAQRSISVEDLETFVSTGDIPSSLKWYADRLTVEEQKAIRAILQEPLNVETNVVTTFIDSPIGSSLLRRLLALFWGGPNEEALLKALRASLGLGPFVEGGLTVVNAIREYPGSQLRVDVGGALA
ncbi:MAG: alpha/beta hydrolase, partial [Synechococcus sp.]